MALGKGLDQCSRFTLHQYCIYLCIYLKLVSATFLRLLSTIQGLDIKNVNSQGHNALHKAAYGGHRDICEWLQDGPLRVDPEASLEDVRGQTPAALAIKGGFPELGKWLTRHRNSTPTRTLEGDAFS